MFNFVVTLCTRFGDNCTSENEMHISPRNDFILGFDDDVFFARVIRTLSIEIY